MRIRDFSQAAVVEGGSLPSATENSAALRAGRSAGLPRAELRAPGRCAAALGAGVLGGVSTGRNTTSTHHCERGGMRRRLKGQVEVNWERELVCRRCEVGQMGEWEVQKFEVRETARKKLMTNGSRGRGRVLIGRRAPLSCK